MQDYIYSVISFLAMAIHLIINPCILAGVRMISARGEREYRRFLWSVFAYYIVDAVWGVLAGLGWTRLLYVDTMLYFIALAVSVLTWCHFAIAYLNPGKGIARTLLGFGYALLSLYVVLLTVNLFTDCVFYFDAEGRYIAGTVRALLFYPLAALNVPMAIFALSKTRGCEGLQRRRFLAVFLYCLIMVVAVVLQIIWTLWPYYALGCLLGTCFLHVFLVEGERAEMRKTAIKHEEAVKHMAELEKALARARAAEKARSQFFSIVSHDIRTPLNAIIGFSEMLKQGFESPAEQNLAINSILMSSRALLNLVNDILDLSKLESGRMNIEPEPTDVVTMMAEMASSFGVIHQKSSLNVMCRAAGVPTLMLDPHRLRQIAFNLMGNAVKFTDKGYIELRAAFKPDADGSKGLFTMEVEDTGCGIGAEDLKKLARPFVQLRNGETERGGTGLGLHICRLLARAMGGELKIASELGKGATFSVVIPGVRVARGAVAASNGAPVAPAHRNFRVLVADDTKLNQLVLKTMFAKLGVTNLTFANNGREALDLLAARGADAFDFVLTDANMPELSGMELVAAIRANPALKGLKVYLFTAEVEMRETYAQKGFDGLLLKPATLESLRKLLP